jgi:pyrimidine and pyridine-specific 5'-nucleotidase
MYSLFRFVIDTYKDDSYINAKGAQEFGWTTAHMVEPHEKLPESRASAFQIRDLEELREVFPELF